MKPIEATSELEDKIRTALRSEADLYSSSDSHRAPSSPKARAVGRVTALLASLLLLSVGALLFWMVGGATQSNDQDQVKSVVAPANSDGGAGLSAHLVLPTQSMAPGGMLSGSVVVQNNTGGSKSVVGCGELFQVLLQSDRASQRAGGFGCAMSFVIPEGQSTFPVTIKANYTACSADTADPPCMPDGSEPPLPVGEYRVSLAQPSGLAVSIAPTEMIEIRGGT
jgi:hypothetical protein